jgi:hypothetical protein
MCYRDVAKWIETLRNYTRSVLPIVLVALLVQIFAPLGAGLAAAAASDPLLSAPICSHGDVSAGSHQTPANPHHHDECCPFCRLAHGGNLSLPATSFFVVAPVALIQRIEWINRSSLLPTGGIICHARARAPPTFS